jgi:hypothetical protein
LNPYLESIRNVEIPICGDSESWRFDFHLYADQCQSYETASAEDAERRCFCVPRCVFNLTEI